MKSQKLYPSKEIGTIIAVWFRMTILSEARYENKTLKPARDLPLKEGESVIIEIKRPVSDQMYGILAIDKKNADIIIEMDGWDWIFPLSL